MKIVFLIIYYLVSYVFDNQVGALSRNNSFGRVVNTIKYMCRPLDLYTISPTPLTRSYLHGTLVGFPVAKCNSKSTVAIANLSWARFNPEHVEMAFLVLSNNTLQTRSEQGRKGSTSVGMSAF